MFARALKWLPLALIAVPTLTVAEEPIFFTVKMPELPIKQKFRVDVSYSNRLDSKDRGKEDYSCATYPLISRKHFTCDGSPAQFLNNTESASEFIQARFGVKSSDISVQTYNEGLHAYEIETKTGRTYQIAIPQPGGYSEGEPVTCKFSFARTGESKKLSSTCSTFSNPDKPLVVSDLPVAHFERNDDGKSVFLMLKTNKAVVAWMKDLSKLRKLTYKEQIEPYELLSIQITPQSSGSKHSVMRFSRFDALREDSPKEGLPVETMLLTGGIEYEKPSTSARPYSDFFSDRSDVIKKFFSSTEPAVVDAWAKKEELRQLALDKVSRRGVIQSVKATYGPECVGAPNNYYGSGAKEFGYYVENECRGQSICKYTINQANIGDNCRGTEKSADVTWLCERETVWRKLPKIAKEAHGKEFILTCPRIPFSQAELEMQKAADLAEKRRAEEEASQARDAEGTIAE